MRKARIVEVRMEIVIDYECPCGHIDCINVIDGHGYNKGCCGITAIVTPNEDGTFSITDNAPTWNVVTGKDQPEKGVIPNDGM